MANGPFEALKKASTIGPAMEVKRGEMPLAPFGGAILTSARDILTPVAKAMGKRLFQQANPIFRGLQKAGMFAGDRTVQLGRPISMAADEIAAAQAALPAEFTPVGGESLYNAIRAPVKAIKDPLENIYQAILAKGGR